MQIKLAKEIVKRFYYKKRFRLYFVIFLSLIASLLEYLGLFLIFQFIVILSNPDSLYANKIFLFFNNFLNIDNSSLISLILGISVALIYIFKNIYMYLFTKINSSLLQDISISMALKIIKNILFADFIKVNSILNSDKQGAISKINIVIWEYLIQYINFLVNITIIIMLITFLLIKFTKIAVFSLCFVAILSLIEYVILKSKSNYQNKHYSRHFDALTKLMYIVINASKEIRINNKSSYFLSQAEEKYKNLANMNKKACINGVFHIYFTEISVMSTFIIILFILYFTSDFSNQMLIVTLGAIITVILRITPAINRAQSSIYGINSNENIVKDILNFDKQFPDVVEISETNEKLPFEKQIELKNISYKYYNSQIGLENINLVIKKGEFIGIVGASGCCKTTLSLLIAGLIKAQKGEIIIDDAILEKETYNKWQNNISILSQDFSIIKENTYENLNEEIINKLDLKNLSDNPLNLSFGQKQRIALADSLIQDKSVLILDEATSSLDVLSEEKINNILFELKGKKTIISIAHRLQILKHCDRIIYMDCGRIIDIDNFINLNNKYDNFKKMIELSNFKL